MNSYPDLLDHLSTATMLLDMNGRFRYLNPSAEKALGITARNLLGKRYSYFIDSESLPLRQWLEQLTSPESKLFDQKQLHLKSGQLIETELCLQRIELTQPMLLIEWQSSDMAKQHQQEQEWHRQQHIQQELLKNLAHEIKTPLSGIAGAAQLLQMSATSEYQSFSQIISKEVTRLSQLVDRMLLGQQKASQVSLNIHQIIEEVIGFIELQTLPDLQIKRDYDPSLPEIFIAPEQIYQVLLNLAQNALDALSSIEKPILNIKTRITSEHPLHKIANRSLCVSIIDNGIGIPKKFKRQYIFSYDQRKKTALGLDWE